MATSGKLRNFAHAMKTLYIQLKRERQVIKPGIETEMKRKRNVADVCVGRCTCSMSCSKPCRSSSDDLDIEILFRNVKRKRVRRRLLSSYHRVSSPLRLSQSSVSSDSDEGVKNPGVLVSH